MPPLSVCAPLPLAAPPPPALTLAKVPDLACLCPCRRRWPHGRVDPVLGRATPHACLHARLLNTPTFSSLSLPPINRPRTSPRARHAHTHTHNGSTPGRLSPGPTPAAPGPAALPDRSAPRGRGLLPGPPARAHPGRAGLLAQPCARPGGQAHPQSFRLVRVLCGVEEREERLGVARSRPGPTLLTPPALSTHTKTHRGDVDGHHMLVPSWNQHEPVYCGCVWGRVCG